MRIFQIIKRVFAGGGQGVEMSMGSETQTAGQSFATTLAQGQDTQDEAFQPGPRLSTGTDSHGVTHSLTGEGTHTTGTDTQTDAFTEATTLSTGTDSQDEAFTQTTTLSTGTDSQDEAFTQATTLSTGTDSQDEAFAVATTLSTGTDSHGSFTASATANVDQFTSAASNTTNSGSTAWQNPTNAQGEFDATNTTWTLAGSVGPVSGNATLKCTIPAIGATPTGFTRGDVKIAIRHLWDLVIATPLVDTASTVMELRTSADVLIATLISRNEDSTGGDLSQATLLTEEYVITSLVSEAQLAAGLRIWCTAAANLALPTSGNANWTVDGVHLRTVYTRTGIT